MLNVIKTLNSITVINRIPDLSKNKKNRRINKATMIAIKAHAVSGLY